VIRLLLLAKVGPGQSRVKVIVHPVRVNAVDMRG
jgi:hypothetical protein